MSIKKTISLDNMILRNKIFPILISLAFIFFSLNMKSQQSEIDSLKKLLPTTDSIADIYYQIAYLIHYENYDSCLYYCKKSIEYTKEEDIENLTYVSMLCAVTYKNLGQYDSALFYIKQARDLFEQDDYWEGTASCDNNIARIYQDIGDYDKALSYYQESMAIFEKNSDTINLGNVYSNIGELYMEIGNYEDAISFFTKSNEYYKLAKLRKGQAFVYSDLASIYSKQKNYIRAIKYYETALDIWIEEDRKTEVAEVYLNIAEIYLTIKLYDEAYVNYSKAKTFYTETDHTYGIAESTMGIGDYYYALGQTDNAIKNYKETLDILRDLESDKLKLSLFYKLYSSFKIKNNYTEALNYLEKNQILKDSVFNIEQAQNLNNLQVKYELNEKENQINDLKQKAKIKQLEIDKKTAETKNRTIVLFMMIIIALGLAMFGVVFFRQYKAKNKLSKELLVRVNEREVLLKELHHRVKNNLQIISSLLNLQKNYSNNMTLDEILEISRNRISTMVSIHEKLYKSNNLKSINIADYIDEIATSLVETLNKSSEKISLKLNIDEIFFEINTAIPFGLILNEMITNSIKHAFKNQQDPQIGISGKTENKTAVIEYTDNGKGLPENFDINKTNSLGMKLISGMTKQIKGSFAIEKTSAGVKFMLKIPIEE